MILPNVRSLLCSVVVAGLALSAVIADASAGPDEAARLFREGRAAMKAEDYASAAEKLARSQQLDPSPGTLLNLALCEEKLGQLGKAWTHIQAVLEVLPPGDPRRPIAEEKAGALKVRVPWIVLELDDSVADNATIQLDDRRLQPPELSHPIAVDPGRHKVTVSTATGTTEEVVDISEGETKDVHLNVNKSNPIGTTDTVDSGSGSPTGAYILLGVGAAGVLTGSYLWLELNKKQDTVDNNCDAAKQCNDRGLTAAEDGKSLAPIYAGAWIVGAVGLATGTYFLLSSDDKPGETGTRVGAAPLPGGACVGAAGRF